MADSDKELLALGAEPHDDELKALGGISPEEQAKVSKYISQPQVPMMESARAGLANGGTFGFAPRMGAALGAGLEKGAGAPMGPEGFPLVPGSPLSGDKKLSDLYNEYLKYNNERNDKAKAANPGTYHAAEFAGAIASPLNKIGAAAKLGKEAPLIAKMGNSALAGARMGTVGGLSQSKDLTDIPQDIENAGSGAVMGTALGAVVPPVGAGIKSLAKGTANLVSPLIGKPGEMFSKGMRAGVEGSPNLSGEPGQIQAVEERNDFADKFVQDVHNVLSSNAKNKHELIAGALAKSQLTPAEAVQAVSQKYLQANPKLNEETARKELAQLKEMFLTAAEGPEKTETVRQYPAGNQPPPAPPVAQAPPMPPVPEVAQPSPQAAAPTAPQAQSPVSEGTPTPVPSQAPVESPSDFEGYEAVHKATIDPEDEEARKAFQHKVNEKLADEESLGKNTNPNEVQIDEKKIPGSDKVRLIAKRAITKEPADAFEEQAQALEQTQKEHERLQALLDKQNEQKLKMQQQQDAEMLKPQFQDVQQTVREGGRNLQDPAELSALQKNLQSKSQFSEGRGFSSQQMNKMAGDAAKDVANLIKLTVPETVPVDERLNAFNNVAESLGIDTNKLQLPGGEGQLARQNAMKKILGVLNPEAATDKSQLSQKSIDYVQQQLNRVHPDIGQAFGQEAAKHAENAATMNEIVKPQTVGGGGPVFSSVRRGLNKTAYAAGHAIGSEVNKMEPGIAQANKIFQNYTPDALKNAGAAAAQSTNQAVQQMGQVLSKLATADDRTRNSMMFVLEQQAGYRSMMAPYFQKQEQGTPQAKDKTLEKYK